MTIKHIEVDEDTHTKIKILAVKNKMTIKDYVKKTFDKVKE